MEAVEFNHALPDFQALGIGVVGLSVDPVERLRRFREKHHLRFPLVSDGDRAIGQAFGGKVVRADLPMHGKTSAVRHEGKGVFRDIPSPLVSTRYHSLVMERESFPDALEITAETDGGVIMGLQHKSDPVFGVQFHPESIASEHGHALLHNFLKTAGHNE